MSTNTRCYYLAIYVTPSPHHRFLFHVTYTPERVLILASSMEAIYNSDDSDMSPDTSSNWIKRFRRPTRYTSSQNTSTISPQRSTFSPPEQDAEFEIKNSPALNRCTLPLELIERIFFFFFLKCKTFSDISAFSMANTRFRTIALRRYMRTLHIESRNQLVSHILMHYSIVSRSVEPSHVGFHWVKYAIHAYMLKMARLSHSVIIRNLSIAPVVINSTRLKFKLFPNLRSLKLSLATTGGATQKDQLIRLYDNPLAPMTMLHMTSLTLTSLSRIDALLLNIVGKTFPMLMNLHLSCSENLDMSCCWICFEESSTALIHSPIPNYYADVRRLTVSHLNAAVH